MYCIISDVLVTINKLKLFENQFSYLYSNNIINMIEKYQPIEQVIDTSPICLLFSLNKSGTCAWNYYYIPLSQLGYAYSYAIDKTPGLLITPSYTFDFYDILMFNDLQKQIILDSFGKNNYSLSYFENIVIPSFTAQYSYVSILYGANLLSTISLTTNESNLDMLDNLDNNLVYNSYSSYSYPIQETYISQTYDETSPEFIGSMTTNDYLYQVQENILSQTYSNIQLIEKTIELLNQVMSSYSSYTFSNPVYLNNVLYTMSLDYLNKKLENLNIYADNI